MDGIDNDGDADAFKHSFLLAGIKGDPETLVPTFTAADFESRFLVPGDTLVLINDADFSRIITTYPAGGGEVVSQGRTIQLPASGLLVEEDTVANSLDEDFDGLIDERATLHLFRFDEITGTEKPVRYINYFAFAPGDTIKRGFITAGTDAEWNCQNVAPMIDESRDDGFDNDGDWDLATNDSGLDGVGDTGDPGEGDGLPTSGAGTDFPGEANIDKTDVTETDLIGLTSAVQVPVGSFSFGSPDGILWNRFMVPGNFELPRPTGEYDTFVSSGYFPLDPGERQRMAISVAIATGGINKDADIESVIRKQQHAFGAYEVDYQFAQALPKVPLLLTSYPNPFNAAITIRYRLADPADVELAIFDLGGRLVRQLGNSVQAAGQHLMIWDGRLSSLQIRGRETLVAGSRLNLWRAPILNELQSWGEAEARDWYDIGLDMLEETADTVYVERESPGEIVISISTRASAPRFTAGYKNSYQYIISADGTIRIEYTGIPFGAFLVRWLPRFGLQLRLQEDIDHFEWFGRGPFETYPDRKTGARIGRFSVKVSDQYVPYIVPQDQGNRTDVRWASLTDKDGVGLKVSADFPMNVSVTTIANFDRALYPFQLEEAGAVILNIDYSITGVGGTPIPVRPQYRTYPQQYRFSIQLEPLF